MSERPEIDLPPYKEPEIQLPGPDPVPEIDDPAKQPSKPPVPPNAEPLEPPEIPLPRDDDESGERVRFDS